LKEENNCIQMIIGIVPNSLDNICHNNEIVNGICNVMRQTFLHFLLILQKILYFLKLQANKIKIKNNSLEGTKLIILLVATTSRIFGCYDFVCVVSVG
jgi:hypothetical protein